MVKLIEQLQSPKLWSVIIGLLVSAGLIEFSDSQVGEVAGALTGLFTALGMVVLAVFSQDGDNKAKVETARAISREPVTTAREMSLSQPRSVLVDVDVAEQLTRMKNEIYGLRGRILELEQARNIRASALELEQANAKRYSTDSQAVG